MTKKQSCTGRHASSLHQMDIFTETTRSIKSEPIFVALTSAPRPPPHARRRGHLPDQPRRRICCLRALAAAAALPLPSSSHTHRRHPVLAPAVGALPSPSPAAAAARPSSRRQRCHPAGQHWCRRRIPSSAPTQPPPLPSGTTVRSPRSERHAPSFIDVTYAHLPSFDSLADDC